MEFEPQIAAKAFLHPRRTHRRRAIHGIKSPNPFSSKEAYGPESDLAATILHGWKGPKHQMRHRLSEWAYGVQESRKGYVPAFPFRENQRERLAEALLATSLLNIKKSDGESACDHDDLVKWAREDKALIENQIELLAPQVIVLCGNGYALEQAGVKSLFDGKTGAKWIRKSRDRVVIDFIHPALRSGAAMAYYALMAMYQIALSET